MDLFEKWHINDGKAIGLGEACQEYVKTVAEVAEKDDAYYMLVALIPCGRLWSWIGQKFKEECVCIFLSTIQFPVNLFIFTLLIK